MFVFMDAKPALTVPAIFNAFGGTSAMAKLFDVGQSTASEMKRRGSIPVRYWHCIIDKSDTSGRKLTLEDLHSAHREPVEAVA